MRIRKNVKLSSILNFSSNGCPPPEKLVCLLNQSPWDVINFSDELEGEDDSFAENGRLRDSIHGGSSITSTAMMEHDQEDENRCKKTKLCTSVSSKKGFRGVAVDKTRGRTGRATKNASCSGYEYYYYSGFGPQWGKNRGAATMGDDDNMKWKSKEGFGAEMIIDDDDEDNGTIKSESQEVEMIEEDDEDEDDEYFGGGRKRGRKLVKARSLKSLM